MINEKLHPFTTDHSKCLNCQMRDGEKLADSNRHSHLCSECQWHLSGIADKIRRDNLFVRELKDIESDLNDILSNAIYFDETHVPDVIKLIESRIANDYDPKLDEILERLKQIVKLGWSGLIHYD